MSNFIDEVIKNAKQQIKYSNTITTGEITKNNGDGTYSVKIANASSAVPEMGTLNYEDNFRIGEIVTVGFEFGCKESPKIFGHAKKIKQIPKPVEVDYSGEEGGGVQEETVTVYGDTEDGYLTGSKTGDGLLADYNEAHDQATADSRDISSDDIKVGQGYSGSPFASQFYRAALYFDGASIPANAIITSATLSIYVTTKRNVPNNFNIVIQDGQPNYPGSTLALSDYLYSHWRNNGGQINTASITINQYSVITLNSNGMAWINKGGTTKFCIRSSEDIASLYIAPDFLDYIIFYSADKGGDYRPKLAITYTI